MGRRTIHKPIQSVFWAVVKGDVIHVGETTPNERTDTGMGDFIEAPTIDALIAKLGSHKQLLPSAPKRDAELIPDKIYNDRGTIKSPSRRPRS